MMNRGVMDRQMFRNGGAAGFPDLNNDGKITQKDILMGRGVKFMQDGGMAGIMAAAPGMAGGMTAQDAVPPEAASVAMQSMDPAVLEQMLGSAQQSLSNLDDAEDFETVINSIRGDEAPLESRYEELAEIVGPEDAGETPESVLALLQPVMMMNAVDQGIGGLAEAEMTQPVEGDMAGGIMSTVAEPPPEEMPPMGMEGPPPVNFNQGGLVRRGDNQPVKMMNVGGDPFATAPGRLGELARERYALREGLLGDPEARLKEQRDLTQAQILFDIANTGLAFAAPMQGERSGMSPAERLAMAAQQTKLIPTIGARAQQQLAQKQAIDKERQGLQLAALGSAETAMAAEAKAAADLNLSRLKGAQKIAEIKLEDKLSSASAKVLEAEKQKGRIGLEAEKQKGQLGLENQKQRNREALERVLQINREALEILRKSNAQENIILTDKLTKENIELRGNIELGKMQVANEYDIAKMDKAHEQATELQNSRLTVQENIAENRLKLDTINSALNQARADKELQIQQQRLDLAQETEARIKSLEEQKLALDTRKVDLEAAASSLDRFGTSVDGRIMNIITGKGVFQPNETAAMLAERYGRGETTAEEDITLNQAIEYFVAPKPVWDADNRRYTLTEGNKLAQEWRQAIEKRQGVEGKTVPTLGDSPKVGSGTSPADNVIKGLTATKGDLPRFDATGQPIDIKDTTYQSIIAGLDPTLATGSPTAFKQVLNRTVETLLPIFNQPFPETSRAADMLNNLNTLTTVIQMQALPGKEGEQLRAELKNVLPEPAAWTKGDQTAYNKIKNTIANLNASLLVLYSGGASASEAGKIERNIVALNTIKDAYAQLGRGYELKMGGGTGDQKMFEGLFR